MAVRVGLYVSIVLLIVIIFRPTKDPSSLEAKATSIITDLLLAYIASFIFFMMNDAWKEVEIKAQVEPMVVRRIGHMLRSYNIILSHLQVVEAPYRGGILLRWDNGCFGQMLASYHQDRGQEKFRELMNTWADAFLSISSSIDTILVRHGEYDPQLNLVLEKIETIIPNTTWFNPTRYGVNENGKLAQTTQSAADDSFNRLGQILMKAVEASIVLINYARTHEEIYPREIKSIVEECRIRREILMLKLEDTLSKK